MIVFKANRLDNDEVVFSTCVINLHGYVYLKHPDENKIGHWIMVRPDTYELCDEVEAQAYITANPFEESRLNTDVLNSNSQGK